MGLSDLIDDPDFSDFLGKSMTLLPDGFCDPVTYNVALHGVNGWTDPATSSFLPKLPRFAPETLRFFRTYRGVVFPSPGGLSLQQLYRGLNILDHRFEVTIEDPCDAPDCDRFPIQGIEPGWIAVTFDPVAGSAGRNALAQAELMASRKTRGRVASAAEGILAVALYAGIHRGQLPRVEGRVRTRQDAHVSSKLSGTTWCIEVYHDGISLTRVSVLEAASDLVCLASYVP